jgi:2-polyprenyl-3-methyl-5-hydroxy-6-metoxy-1,4-benzoquinol methylase
MILYNFQRDEVADQLPKSYSKVLEVGCSTGGFRRSLVNEHEYWGVEPHYEAFGIVKEQAFRALNGTFDEVFDELPNNYFDLVICNDVIEHMDNYLIFLQKLKNKMKTNARIVGSIPNVRYISNLYNLLVLKDWEYEDLGILDKTHLRFFTQKSIRRMFTENGYTIESFKGIHRIEFHVTSIKSLTKNFITCILGPDTKYTNFSFRVKYEE